MKVTCPGCSTVYNVPEERLTKSVTQMGCRKCGANLVFFKSPGAEGPSVPRPPTPGPPGEPEKKRWSPLKLLKYAAIGLVALIVVGALAVYGLFHMAKRSQEYKLARVFIIKNHEINKALGGRIDEGPSLTSFNVKSSKGQGRADMGFEVAGPAGSTDVRVLLEKDKGVWRVVKAAYLGKDGRPVMVLPGRARPASPKPAEAAVKKPREKRMLARQRSKVHLDLARRYYRDKMFKHALRECTRAISVDPKNPDAYFLRGVYHVKKGDKEKGLSDLKKTVALDPGYARAYEYMGWVYGSKKNYDESVAQFSRLIELKPRYAKAYYQRGAAHFKRGDAKSALRDMEKSCKLGYKMGCETLRQFKKAI